MCSSQPSKRVLKSLRPTGSEVDNIYIVRPSHCVIVGLRRFQIATSALAPKAKLIKAKFHLTLFIYLFYLFFLSELDTNYDLGFAVVT